MQRMNSNFMTKILRKSTNKFVVFYKKRCYDIRKGNIMMIPGSKGLKSDEGLHEGGFLNLGPAKNMSKEPFFEEK